jgi:protein O-GlcNAc transferase
MVWRMQPGIVSRSARGLLALALLLRAGNAQEASAALKKADAAYRAGQAALAQRDLVAAQADFEQVVHLAPSAGQGHSALGAVLVSRGRLQEGIRELEAALAIKKTDTIAQMNLAMAYEQAAEPTRAIPLFHALETDAPQQAQTPAALAAYARCLAAVGKPELAAAKMAAAAKADPDNAQLWDELGSIHAQQRAWPQARQEFTNALRLKPDFALAHMHLGLVLLAQGETEGRNELAQASTLAPGNPAIALELGKALAKAGQDGRAIPVFRTVLDREPGPQTTPASYELALALQRTGSVPEAIALLKKVVAVEPGNANAWTNLGMALAQVQQAKDAVPALTKAVALAPKSATAHQDLAAAYVQLSQFDDAVRELRLALKLDAESPQLHYDLGLALKMKDDAAGAIPEFEAAERLDPQQPESPYVLGVLYMQAGRYAEAAREMKRSLTLRPQNGDGWATLGSVYNSLNELPEAAAALREAARQLPEQAGPHLTLASVLVKQNQLAEATAERKQAADLMRVHMNHQRAEVATNEGNGLLKTGDAAGAAARFNDALGYEPGYAEAHLGLAQVLDLQGKPVDAAAERQKAAQGETKP